MMLGKDQLVRNVLIAILVVFPVVFWLLVGGYGWSDADDGFILGCSWRVYHGALPHRDFIYIRPSLSPLMHALWFRFVPAEQVYFLSRGIVIAQIWLYCLLGGWLLWGRRRDRPGFNRHWPLLALASFFLGVSAFTPMPWHTIDGVLFATAAAWLIFRMDHAAYPVAGGILLFLACATKQSFYPLPVMAIVLLVWDGRWRAALTVAATMAVAVLAGLAVMAQAGMLVPFLVQTRGASSLREALLSGGWNYLASSAFLAMAYMVAKGGLELFLRRRGGAWNPWHAFALFAILAILGLVYPLWKGDGRVNHSTFGLTQLLFLLALQAWAGRWSGRGAPDWAGDGFLLGIAWCASISMGLQTPVLFSAPLLAGAVEWASREERTAWVGQERMLAWALAGSAALFCVASLIHPYMDPGFSLGRSVDLGTVEPRLRHIRSSPENAERLREFRQFAEASGNRFATLPAYPLAYFVRDTLPQLPIDWAMTLEMGRGGPEVERVLRREVRFAILDGARRPEFDDPRRKSDVPLARMVSREWRLLRCGKYYTLYENPDLPGRGDIK